MPSLRGRIFRFLVKQTAGRKFRRAGKSIPDLRRLVEEMSAQQKVPAGTEFEPVEVDGLSAEWVMAPGKGGEKTVLYLHGGGFVSGSPATHRELAALVSEVTDARVLVIDYHLAPEHPFPAAMEDSLSAYRWLLEKGYSDRRLAIGGDSAGGGLTLQTLLVLRDGGVPLPAAAFFMSPVTDMVRLDGESYSSRAAVDPLIDVEMNSFIVSQYVGDNDPATPLLSPANMDLTGLPPLCIHAGDYEVLLSDSVRLADRARAAGVDVELKVWPGMWHVFQAGARFLPEARRSLDEIGRFVRKRLGRIR